jgi:pimeloyl-ACP methyl ester carboxylesterase
MTTPATPARDSRIEQAAAHWSHRMVANGVPLADFQDVTGKITSWSEWCRSWTLRGEVHEALGRAALDEGRTISAAEHLSTAAACYHFAKFLFVEDREQMRAAHDRAVGCRTLALSHLDPPGERVAIPYEGRLLWGNLRKPLGVARPPVVVMAMGLDSAKEEMHSNEGVFLLRGMATLAFDGPGQGEAEYDLPICPEYERPVAAVIDWIEGRGDLDATRVGLWGVSLGGYYAPRAAAFEPRVRGVIALTGPFNFVEAFGRAPELTRSVFVARTFSRTEDEALAVAARMDLTGVAGRIRCPIHIVGGRLDRVVPPDHAEKLARAVSGPVTMTMVEDGTHVANNRPYKYRPQTGDWMARILRAGT